MAWSEWERYLDQVTNCVVFRYDRADIREELLAHLEDHAQCLMEEGLSKEEAAKEALLAMGDAKEVGEALNKEHNPVLGWIYRISRWVLGLLIVLNLPTVLAVVLMILMTAGQVLMGYDEPRTEEYGAVVWEMDPDVKGKSYQTHFTVDYVRRYEDGTIQVGYRSWNDLFPPSQGWSLSLSYEMEDGERVFGGGSLSSGLISYGEDRLREPVVDDALYVVYYEGATKHRIRIDLPEEDGIWLAPNWMGEEDAP